MAVVLPRLTDLNETITKNGQATFNAQDNNTTVGHKTVTITTNIAGDGTITANGKAIETNNSNDIINSTAGEGTIYKYVGDTDDYCTHGYYYIITN